MKVFILKTNFFRKINVPTIFVVSSYNIFVRAGFCDQITTAEAKIIEVEHRETNSQGYRIIIHPSGRELHFPFDTTAEDSDEVIEEEKCLEPVPKKKDILSPQQKPSTE